MADEFPLTIFCDASCPVCAVEMEFLQARDTHGRLRLLDISAPGFDAARHGFALGDLDAVIHATRPDGSVVRGIDVLRLAYGAAGFDRIVPVTRLPIAKHACDVVYRFFARHRHAISRALAPLIRIASARRPRPPPSSIGRP